MENPHQSSQPEETAGDDEDFVLNPDDVQEEIRDDGNARAPTDDDMQDDDDAQQQEMPDADDMVELVDDSAQGFFGHDGMSRV